MNIVLIGPVFPFKGGISQYTSLMCTTLKKNHVVHLLSYKLQYPHFLYKKEQKDYSNDMLRIDNTDYCINTINPINWVSVAHKINHLKPELVILQWWHPYFTPCYYTICKLLKHTKILFVCHNVFPHERFPLDRILTKAIIKRGNCFIVHSTQDEKDLLSIVPKAVFKKSPLPTFNLFKIKGLSKDEARSILGIQPDERILLFFGLIREYKGLQYIIQAMPQILSHLKNIRLFIVGDFGDSKAQYLQLIEKLGVGSSIEVHDGYIPDKDVEKYFAACDLVTLPYISATQSAVVQTAYSFEKPVIVTDVGGLPEAVMEGKTGYVVPPRDSSAIAEAVKRYFDDIPEWSEVFLLK